MTKRLKVTQKAKEKAKKGLEYNKGKPDSKKAGLTKKEAKEKKINSGIERAKQLIRSDSISYEDAKAVCKFKRFLGMEKTPKTKAAINLWGGEDYIKKACDHVDKYKNKWEPQID